MSQDYVVGPRGPGGTTNAGNGAAIFLPRRHHPAVMIQNTGSATLYANDEDPISAPSPGQPISAGSTLGWDKDRALYVTCPTSTTITITGNSGNLFDVGSLASQISSNLTASGLAAAIAANIAVSGAPPIDAFASVGTANQVVVNGSNSPIIDMRKYQGLFYSIENINAVNGQFSVFWSADAAGLIIIELDAFDMATAGAGGATQGSMMVRGPYALILFNASAGSAQLNLFGSYKAQPNNFYQGQGNGSANGTIEASGTKGMYGWAGTIPVANTWTCQPDVQAGRARLVMRYSTLASHVTLRLAPPTTSTTNPVYVTETNLAVPVGFMSYYDLILPPMPLQLDLTNTDGANALSFRAAFIYQRPYN